MKNDAFHQRFKIPVNLEEERNRFIRAIKNVIRTGEMDAREHHQLIEFPYEEVKTSLSIHFGVPYDHYTGITDLIPNQFLGCLEYLEVIYENIYVQNQRRMSFWVNELLTNAKVDLGVRFKNGKFYPEGSELLDEKLVNDVLNCLDKDDHKNILKPFSDGLRCYLESMRDKNRLKDVIENMYEAMEAFAKYINNNDKDLSANKELLIRNLNLNNYYKDMLSRYIQYANEFRHAVKKRAPRPPLNQYEVEAFIYLSGLFIRLGIKS